MGKDSSWIHTSTSGLCGTTRAYKDWYVDDDILVAHAEAMEKASQRGADV